MSSFGFTRGTGLSRDDRLANGYKLYQAATAAFASAVAAGNNVAVLRGFDGEYEGEIDPSWIFPRADGGGNHSRACAFVASFPLVIEGTRNNSFWTWYPEGEEGGAGPDFAWAGFIVDWTLGDVPVRVVDMDFSGELAARDSGEYGTIITSGIWVQGRTAASYTSKLELHGVTGSGNWNGVVDASESRGTLEYDRCDLSSATAAGCAPLFWFPGETTGGRVHGSSSVTRGGDIGQYLHPSCSIRLTDIEAYGTIRYGVYINGTPTTVPEYCEIDGLTVADDCGFGVQTNKNISTQITSMRARCDSRAVHLLGGADIEGLVCERGSDFIITGTTVAATDEITVNTVVGNQTAVAESAGIVASAGKWSLQNIQLTNQVSTALMGFSGGVTAQMTGARFRQDSGATWSNLAITPSSGLTLILRDVDFGTRTGYDINGNGAFSNMSVRFEGGNLADTVNQGNLQLASLNIATVGFISSSGTRFDSSSGLSLYELPAGYWSRLGIVKGRNPDNVSAGTSITLSPNFDYHVVTGTATVVHLYILVASAAVTRQFDGEVVLEASGAGVTLDGANGEIRLAGGASSRTLADGEKVRFRLDGVAGLIKEL